MTAPGTVLVGAECARRVARSSKGGAVAHRYAVFHAGPPGGESICRTVGALRPVDRSAVPADWDVYPCRVCRSMGASP